MFIREVADGHDGWMEEGILGSAVGTLLLLFNWLKNCIVVKIVVRIATRNYFKKPSRRSLFGGFIVRWVLCRTDYLSVVRSFGSGQCYGCGFMRSFDRVCDKKTSAAESAILNLNNNIKSEATLQMFSPFSYAMFFLLFAQNGIAGVRLSALMLNGLFLLCQITTFQYQKTFSSKLNALDTNTEI